jgi:hypothetical protein
MTLTNEFLSYGSTGIVNAVPEGAWRGLCERPGIYDAKRPSWVAFIYPIGREKSTSQTTEIFPTEWESAFVPRTALGLRLASLRARAVAGGMRLLTEDEVLEEVKRRRGELEDNEADLY